jgi:glutathione peroxidase
MKMVPMVLPGLFLVAGVVSALAGDDGRSGASADPGIHAFTMKTIDGEERSLSAYKGKVVLVVNTASECGYTPQYTGLQELFQKYHDRGFVLAAFPANDFGAQEPGTDAQIKNFCSTKYRTTFDLYSKITVKGPGMHPLYKYLTSRPGMTGDVSWNFNKFLIDRDGHVAARWPSKVEPMSPEITAKIESLLSAK